MKAQPICNICGADRTYSDKFKQYTCRTCASRKSSEWLARNRERHNAYCRKRYRESPARREYHRQYKIKNADKFKQWTRNYTQGERFKVTNRLNKYRRRSKNGDCTPQEWLEIQVYQGGRCVDCGEFTKLTIGHLQPLSKGGSNFPVNIIGQCKSCNSRQHDNIHPLAGKVHALRSVALRAA